MTAEQRRRVEEWFARILELTPPEREEVLAGLEGEDPEVRAGLQRLLSAERKAGSFLETITWFEQERAADAGTGAPAFSDGEQVAGRYRIVRFIQAGGMGEVYEAEDTALRQHVALKTILPEIAGRSRSLERFRREIAMARRVTHPNVCRVFDVGQHTDPSNGSVVTFLTMELLQGETLGQKLKRDGPMGPEEALPLIEQMAEALAAAHEAEVIHRDFKPGNVMLVPRKSGGVKAVVTDFGLAKSTSDEEGEPSLTERGHLIGTLPYMAPEQLGGARPSVATDVYAFGVVMFEMMTGRRPFQGGTPQQDLTTRFSGKPPTVRSFAPELQPEWDKAVGRCLDPAPERRFASAREVVAAIREGSGAPVVGGGRRRAAWKWSGLAAVVALVVAIGVFLFGGAPLLREERRVAVLPFSNAGGDPSNQVLSDGLMETLSSGLSELREEQLWVIPASEVVSANVKSAEGARERFKANLVVTWSVQKRTDGVRLTLNLIDTRDLRQIGSAVIDERSGDYQALQDRAVGKLAELLAVRSARAGGPGSGNASPAAYESYLQAVGHMQRWDKEENLAAAIGLLEQATKRDPAFALAHARLGEAYRMRYALDKNREWLDLALAKSERAAAINPGLAPVQVTLGRVYSTMGENDLALEALERALKLDPRSADAFSAIARVFDTMGRAADAEAAFRKALVLQPDSWLTRNTLGNFYFRQHRYEEALVEWRRVLEITPDNAVAYVNAGAALAESGKVAEARSMYEKAITIAPNYTAYMNLGTLYFREKRYLDAAGMFEKALELNDRDYLLWGNLAAAYWWAPAKRDKAAPTYERAASMAEEALKQRPNDPFVHVDLGGYYAKSHKPKQAIERLETALALAPDHREVHAWAAEAYQAIGRRERAITLIRRAIALGYPVEDLERSPDLDVLLADRKIVLKRTP